MAAVVECGGDTNTKEKHMSLKKALSVASPLTLRIVAECSVTKARACDLILPHGGVITPVFMPVGTQGTMKGITSDQLEGLGCQICLGNTYHLGMRPVGSKPTQQFRPFFWILKVKKWKCDSSVIVIPIWLGSLIYTGTWVDFKSQWFAWVHEVEEESSNGEWTLNTLKINVIRDISRKLCLQLCYLFKRLVTVQRYLSSNNEAWALLNTVAMLCFSSRTVVGFRWCLLLNSQRSLRKGSSSSHLMMAKRFSSVQRNLSAFRTV